MKVFFDSGNPDLEYTVIQWLCHNDDVIAVLHVSDGSFCTATIDRIRTHDIDALVKEATDLQQKILYINRGDVPDGYTRYAPRVSFNNLPASQINKEIVAMRHKVEEFNNGARKSDTR